MQLQVASPILGFEQIENYELEQIDDYFYRLTHGDIVFTLLDPSKVRAYAFDLPPFYARKLEAKPGDALLTLTMVVLQRPIESSVVNFLAPIVINLDKKLLAQVALEERHYPDFALAEKIGSYL